MATISLEERVGDINPDQFMAKIVHIVTRCQDPTCCHLHSFGEYTLVFPEAREWLAITPDNELVWLPGSTILLTSELKKSPKGHQPPPMECMKVLPRGAFRAIEAMLQPNVVEKTTAKPGCYWAYTECGRCGKMQVEETLWLNTVEEVRNYAGTLTTVRKLRSNLIFQALRASNALCTCSNEG